MDYASRLNAVRARIDAACERAGRRPEEVRLIAVTKYVGVEEVRALRDAGVREFGENRPEETVEKTSSVTEAVWHFIGQLQSRKVKSVIRQFDVIHSLDRLSMAERIEREAEQLGVTVPCLVQVNVSGELTKAGLAASEVDPFLRAVSRLEHMVVTGFMTMAPLTDDAQTARPVFRKLAELRNEFRERSIPNIRMEQLSMGMSGDFEVAVEEGATMVRVGSALVR